MTWVKGQSGNPGGRLRMDKPLRELARLYTEEALETTVQLMRGSPQDNVRLSAANLILDRGWGRVPIIVDNQKPSDLSDEELIQRSIETIVGKVDNNVVKNLLTKALHVIQQPHNVEVVDESSHPSGSGGQEA